MDKEYSNYARLEFRAKDGNAAVARLAALREKYDLHMTAERFVSEDLGADEQYIRR